MVSPDEVTATAATDLSGFKVEPSNWGESVELDHGDCGWVAEWNWDEECNLAIIVAAARDHLRDSHGGQQP